MMELGAFSISLNVQDIEASNDFYQKLGFKEFGGDINQKWLIMKNSEYIVGLFQGMLEQNTLTFNPGWDQNGYPLETFTDVREIQDELKKNGLEVSPEIEMDTQGPAHIMVFDPDGNPVLIDQHI